MAAHITRPVEYVYYALMLRWVRTAPPDGHWDYLDGKRAQNTQAARFAYILRKIDAGSHSGVYRTIARHARRNDGRSYVSQDSSWMKQPIELGDAWFLEGCMSLLQKQTCADSLRHAGCSQALIDCIRDFVAALPIDKYHPTESELEAVLREIQDEESNSGAPSTPADVDVTALAR